MFSQSFHNEFNKTNTFTPNEIVLSVISPCSMQENYFFRTKVLIKKKTIQEKSRTICIQDDCFIQENLEEEDMDMRIEILLESDTSNDIIIQALFSHMPEEFNEPLGHIFPLVLHVKFYVPPFFP